MNKKIGELLGPIDNSLVNVIFDQTYLPEKFIKVSDLEEIKIGYERAFEKRDKNGLDNDSSKDSEEHQINIATQSFKKLKKEDGNFSNLANMSTNQNF